MTIAKTGRSIKNLPMALLAPCRGRSFWRPVRLRLYKSPGPRFLKTFDDHAIAFLQALQDLGLLADMLSCDNAPRLHLIVRAEGKHRLQALQFLYRALWDQECIPAILHVHPNAA